MRGSVIGFDPDSNTGAITTPEGGRYDFVRRHSYSIVRTVKEVRLLLRRLDSGLWLW